MGPLSAPNHVTEDVASGRDLRFPAIMGVAVHESVRTTRLNLELDPDFHDLRAGDLEIGAGPLGVVMHEGEQSLAPAGEPGTPPGRNDRLVAGVVDRPGEIVWILPPAMASASPSGTLGSSMKPKRSSARVSP